MPQLDIMTISMTYVWAWLTLTTTTRKIQTILLSSGPKAAPLTNLKKPTWTLPWT